MTFGALKLNKTSLTVRHKKIIKSLVRRDNFNFYESLHHERVQPFSPDGLRRLPALQIFDDLPEGHSHFRNLRKVGSMISPGRSPLPALSAMAHSGHWRSRVSAMHCWQVIPIRKSADS